MERSSPKIQFKLKTTTSESHYQKLIFHGQLRSGWPEKAILDYRYATYTL